MYSEKIHPMNTLSIRVVWSAVARLEIFLLHQVQHQAPSVPLCSAEMTFSKPWNAYQFPMCSFVADSGFNFSAKEKGG